MHDAVEMNRDTETERDRVPLSENTSIRLGLLVAILGCFLTGSGASIWWASGTTADLRNIKEIMLSQGIESRDLQKDAGELRSRVQVIESQGSPAITPRVKQLEQDLQKLREDFEIHKAASPTQPK